MKRGKVTNRLLDRYLGIPALNLLASLRRKGRLPQDPERVGILVNPALGDTMLASAVTQDLRIAFPRARLVLFATGSNMAVARMLPGIDQIEVLPIMRPTAAVRLLRRQHLDLMVDFTSWQRITALYTLLSGAKFKAGFRRDGQYRHRGYDATVPHLGSCHELENMRRLAELIAGRAQSSPSLHVPDGSIPEVASNVAELVAFHAWATGTHRALREWKDDNWIELGKRLRSPGRVFLLTGGPADQQRCDALCQRMVSEGIPARVLIGRGGLDEVARVLQRAALLVTVNTGIMHLGAILGTPTVALNGPNSEHRWGPVGPRTANVPTSDGSGGFLDLGFEFNGRDVMGKITVDAVMSAIHELLPTEAAESALQQDAVHA